MIPLTKQSILTEATKQLEKAFVEYVEFDGKIE